MKAEDLKPGGWYWWDAPEHSPLRKNLHGQILYPYPHWVPVVFVARGQNTLLCFVDMQSGGITSCDPAKLYPRKEGERA